MNIINPNIEKIKKVFPQITLIDGHKKSNIKLLDEESLALWHAYDDILHINNRNFPGVISLEEALKLIKNKINFENFQ